MDMIFILLLLAIFLGIPVIFAFSLIYVLFKQAFRMNVRYVNWIGPDDEETCPECREAFRGNPYPLEKAPKPGSFKCGDNCRHALQESTCPPGKKRERIP